ncbi:hypothetical protein SAMN04490248_11295 [Salinihabitans flavidus]|uniref:Repeat domain-containing protein n=1 Tax=Salinihabitans flavidus TaxID=569882 RepID=A0A1H8SKB5_9RHOB|nr:hypothetical protein [Salinihabitans flavidus]SEO79439.1 hypothetical protein SAMN04490248_11295 [Salinihabitans flavidus]
MPIGLRALGVSLVFWAGGAAAQGTIIGAEYGDPTTRYDHAVLGDAVEWGSLTMRTDTCRPICGGNGLGTIRITLPETRVFEDIEPKLVDVGAETGKAAMVVESDLRHGARLALYGAQGMIAATPFIGQRNRWLAPIGAADLDGDGHVEIAYVDRPHLARTLRVWRFQGGALEQVADATGLTNHRIGQDFITGGIRDCGEGPELITVDANWTHIMASRFDGTRIETRRLAPYEARQSVAQVLDCEEN